MASTGQREQHPATLYYALTMVLLLLTVLLGFIAVFVPWVQKDIAIGTRAYAYPFKTCLVKTFSTVNEQTCLDNDFIVGPLGAPVSQGNKTCEAFVLTTIAFVFISVIGGVLLLLLFLWIILTLWARPMCLAYTAQACLLIIFISCVLAWIFFICFAEYTCVEGSIFPVQNYSYGFILYIFCTALSLAAVVTGFLALKKLRKYQPLAQEDKEASDEQFQTFNGEYPEYNPQQSMMAAPTPMAPMTSMAPMTMAPVTSYTSAPMTSYTPLSTPGLSYPVVQSQPTQFAPVY